MLGAKGREQALRECVVVTIASSAHARSDAVATEREAVVVARIDDFRGRKDGRSARRRSEMALADQPTARREAVENGCKIQPSLTHWTR